MINIREFLGLEYYISEIDQFLAELDQLYPKPSASQRAEMKKYARIIELRDNPTSQSLRASTWDKF